MLAVLLTLLVAVLFAVVVYLLLKIHRLTLDTKKQVEAARKAANKQSRATLKGQICEELLPLLPGCPWIPSDMKFFGKPVDYCIYHGMTEARDGNGSEIEIIFAEVKTASMDLDKIQKLIRDAVVAKRVKWFDVSMNDGQITAKEFSPRASLVNSKT